MGSGHAHGRAEDRTRLWLVLAVTATVLAVEAVGFAVSGSLALLADAGHLLTDVAAVTIALGASYLARRPADERRTFGYHRAEILAALGNAALIAAVAGFLAYSGIKRLADPPTVDASQMLVFAMVALVANGLSLALLVARKNVSLNMRAAFLEILGDTIGSGLVLVAGVVIATTGWRYADPLASLMIAVLIVPRAVALVRAAVSVLFESTPADVDVGDVRVHLSRMPGVVDVHDLHAWTITSGMPSLSAHVTVSDDCLRHRGVGAVLDDLATCVREDFGIEHATFQVEPESHRSHEDLGQPHA